MKYPGSLTRDVECALLTTIAATTLPTTTHVRVTTVPITTKKTTLEMGEMGQQSDLYFGTQPLMHS